MTAVLDAPPAELLVEASPPRGRRRAPSPPRRRRPRRPALLWGPLPVQPQQPKPMWATVVVPALAMLAAVCGWFLLQVIVLGGLEQSRAQLVLRADLREQLAEMTAPLGGAIEPGAPVALLEIPTLGLDQVVVEGTAAGDLMSGPGHRRDTVLPGQEGRSLVYGRTFSYGGPFRSVPRLQEGDGITITTAQGEFVYRVDAVRRDGDPLPSAPGDGVGQLVLVAAEGSGPLAALAPDRTVYVDATLVGEAAEVPSGRPATIPDTERAMHGDPGALPVLTISLQGLLAAIFGIFWAVRHHPAAIVRLIAGPVLVAMSWFVTDAAVQLLPNLL